MVSILPWERIFNRSMHGSARSENLSYWCTNGVRIPVTHANFNLVGTCFALHARKSIITRGLIVAFRNA
ncbi:MAG: hypothetical protein CMJ81_23370 [Planctomycetaceae bacterium]|nr:hypothetical protein [Planctomycetaceae bacterium]